MSQTPASSAGDERASPWLKIWAIAATLVCLALVAYIVTSRLEEAESARLGRVAATTRASAADAEAGPGVTSAEAAARALEPETELPEAFVQLSGPITEWVSEDDGSSQSGYAVLLDVERRRELIIEHCRHGGYFDDDRREPTGLLWSCEQLINGGIATAEGNSLIVLDRRGRGSSVGFALADEGEVEDARLTLTIGGEELILVPGSKNDLLQRLERRPEVLESAQAAVDFESEQVAEALRREEARRMAEQSASSAPDDSAMNGESQATSTQ